MKNKLYLILSLAVIAFFIISFLPRSSDTNDPNELPHKTGKGIQFIESDWKMAVAEAKKQHKYIFLDAYASWCGPCKLLKRKTFPDSTVGNFFNKNFINVAIDMEKGDGPSLSDIFGVSAYPTLIITDENGIRLTYTQGYISPKELIEFGEFGLKQQNSKK